MTAAVASGHDHRRADIQGLRAIAVLSVVLYHIDARLLPGGFVGVDIFFVISGFLITGILVRELERDRMSIAGFYERRVRRLFPALFVMLACALTAGSVLLAPHDYAELARTTLSTLFFVSNIDFYTLSSYFDGAAADKPLLHTWSLAVEEQFYIAFPLLLALLWKTARQHLVWIVGAGVLIGLAFSAWGAFEHPTGAFYLTPFRAFELAIGAFVSLTADRAQISRGAREALAAAGLGLVAVSFFVIDVNTPFPGFAAFAPCLGAALVIFAGIGGPTAMGRTISLPPFLFFGAISYSLYLWHWPVLAFARHYFHGEPTLAVKAVLIIGAIGLATASFAFIEQPALRRRTPRSTVFAAGAGAMAMAAIVAGAVVFGQGLPQRFSPQVQALFDANEDFNPRRDECHSDEDRPIPYASNCVWGAPGAAPVAAVWGDSAGAELVVALGEVLARRGQATMEITSSACPPAIGYDFSEKPHCMAHNDEVLSALAGDDRIHTVVIALNIARYPTPERDDLFAGVTRAVEALQSSGKKVVLTYPAPNPWFEPPRVIGLMAHRGEAIDQVGIPRTLYEADNADGIAFLDQLSERTNAARFRPADAVCNESLCPTYLPNVGVLYFNGNHLSLTGARLAMARFPLASIPSPEPAQPRALGPELRGRALTYSDG